MDHIIIPVHTFSVWPSSQVQTERAGNGAQRRATPNAAARAATTPPLTPLPATAALVPDGEAVPDADVEAFVDDVTEGAMAEAVANAPMPESAGVGWTIDDALVARATNALRSLVAGDGGGLMALQDA